LYTGMSPLVYSLPVTKTQYLGGRFLAAFALNAFVLLGVQAGSILGVYAGGVDPEIIGPFRPEAYLAAYAFVALPNAFIASTMQFTIALASKRTLASYFGSLMLLFFTFPVPFMLYFLAGEPGLAKLVDPIGFIAIMNEMMSEWTIAEKNTRMFTLHGAMLWNRLLWLAVAWMTLFALYARFRFAGDTAVGRKRAEATDPSVEREPVPAMPAQRPPQSFGWTTQLRQAAAIAGTSFRMLAFSPAGLFMLAAFPALLVLITVVQSQQWGVPIIPRTGYILSKYLTVPITQATDYRLMVPLLIVFFAGELVWRERDAGLHEKMDATPVPDRVLLLGKLAGLSLLLCAYLVSVMLAGAAAQLIRGHYDVQPALYFRILFGLQLPELLLFAVLAMVLQVVINQKYLALLASLVAYLLIVFPAFGIEHNLLIYSASPSWTYTDMRGFADSVGPWLWFKLYWAAWALVIGLVMRLLWVRGLETGLRMRARMGQTRLRPIVAATAIGALIVVVACGGFVFYNTNVRNEYISSREKTARQAEYELRYGHYEGRPQPEKTATRLQIDIDPDRRAASLRGEYRLVNRTALPIDTIHIEPAFYADTRITFDRPFRQVSSDRKLGHDI
ncbi:MAG TPA: ABC transporter permease, partial [Steroidobacteraceae bacterium]